MKYVVPRGAGAPDLHPWPRGQHGIADASIGLKNRPTPFTTHRCEPIFAAGPQKAIEVAIGSADGDALRLIISRRNKIESTKPYVVESPKEETMLPLPPLTATSDQCLQINRRLKHEIHTGFGDKIATPTQVNVSKIYKGT
jgi:hypothetical protein